MAKKQNLSWQLDLRPVTRSHSHGKPPAATAPKPPVVDKDPVKLLNHLMQAVDELRAGIEQLNDRLTAVEGALRDATVESPGKVARPPRTPRAPRNSAIDDVASRPIRQARDRRHAAPSSPPVPPAPQPQQRPA